MPILGENRIIVHYGIEQLSSTTHLGIQSLLEQVGLKTGSLSVGQLVFNVTPKINAAGRMGDGNRAVELLTTQNSARASELAEELVCENKKRRKIQDTVLDDAIRKVNSEVDIKNDKAIILADREWHSGVIGIVASKLKEEPEACACLIPWIDNPCPSISRFGMYVETTAPSELSAR